MNTPKQNLLKRAGCGVIIPVAVHHSQSALDEYKKHNLHSGYYNRLLSQHAAHIHARLKTYKDTIVYTMNKTP